MARFFDIAPAPQSLERLDAWGALDSLPASLDSPLWDSAGIFGFEASDAAHSSGLLRARRISRLGASARGVSSCVLRSSVSHAFGGGGRALGSGRTGLICLRRFAAGDGDAAAHSGGACRGMLAFYLSMSGATATSELLALPRLLHLEGSAGAAGGGALLVLRLRRLSAPGRGQSAALLRLEIKGGDWEQAACPGGSWELAEREPAAWEQAEAGSAAWRESAAACVPWRRKDERRNAWH